MMDIHSRSTEYLQRIASIRQKHRSLYEVEVYVVLLCITALAVFVCLREYLSYAVVVLIPCLLSSIYYYHSLHASSAADLQMSMSSRGRKDSNLLDHNTMNSGSQRAPSSSPALYDLTSLDNHPNSSFSKTNTRAGAIAFKYNESLNLSSPQQLVRRIMLSPSSSSSSPPTAAAFDTSPSKASYNYPSSRHPFYSPLSHSAGSSPLEHAVAAVPQWHTYHSSPPVQHYDFKSNLSPSSAGRTPITISDPLDGGDNKDPSQLLNDVIRRIAARQGVTRVDSSSTLLSPSTADHAAAEPHSYEMQQLEELEKLLVMLSSEIVQTLSLRVADSGMKIAFLQSAADQKRLQAVLELKTDRLDLGLNGRIGWIEVVNQCQLLGVNKELMGRYEWVAARVRYYRQRTEADRDGEMAVGRDQWSSGRRSVRSGR